MKDACQTEKYAQFRRKHGWKHEWRRGNLFLQRHMFGLTFEMCYFPSKEIQLSDLRGHYCWIGGSAWKPPHPLKCDWTKTVQVDLNRDIEVIWRSVTKHTRNAVRQARNRGTWFEEGSMASFGAFWNVYEDMAAREGFRMIKQEILSDYLKTDFCKMFFVGTGEKIIGAYLVLEGEEVARYFCGGSLYKFQHFRPNNLAHWSILEHYHMKGFSTYDMGSCGSKSPEYAIYSFKAGFGKPAIKWNCRKANWLVGKAVSAYRLAMPSSYAIRDW